MKRAFDYLENLRGKQLTREQRKESALQLADLLLIATLKEKNSHEIKEEKILHRMMQNQKGKAFIVKMNDECFRSQNNRRTADQLYFLLKKFKIPSFLTLSEKAKFFLFLNGGKALRILLVPLIRRHIRNRMSKTLLPPTGKKLNVFLEKARKENARINLNHLGEGILGEEEAHERLEKYLQDLSMPKIECISVKVSTLFSQIDHIGFEKSLQILKEPLRKLYRAAKTYQYKKSEGQLVNKLVYLDMEEFKDLKLTTALFQSVLDENEFQDYSAGIVLQSYLPDSFAIQMELTRWAQNRIEAGGAPIRLRIVKGANMGAEKCESSLFNWTIPTFEKKYWADANFKKMMEYAIDPSHAKAVNVGIGSHNLLDISYALILRAETQTKNEVGFEMLKGMAEPMQRVVRKVAGGMLVYSPTVSTKDFQYATAYLLRRLDENTGSGHFLRDIFNLQIKSAAWEHQKEAFNLSVEKINYLPLQPKRLQNRFEEQEKKLEAPFSNEPDTDFSLEKNRLWALEIYQEWKNRKNISIPLCIGGQEIFENSITTDLYTYSKADQKRIKEALSGPSVWQSSISNRSKILGLTANLLRKNRKDLIGAMIADSHKILKEADVEVSESIDFLDYYRKKGEKLFASKENAFEPLGRILVATPWNFPLSIPVSGIAAALIAGNAVIFKPAPETVLVGWELVQLFWKAGVPKEILQFLNCDDDEQASFLVKQKELAAVVLTGSTDTAKKLLDLRPGLKLMAETGGKNAMIITALSDRDLAIKDLVHSAFGHAGQKCSACSLAILEKEVYEDLHFRQQLMDAVKSLKMGSPFDPMTKIPPLIRKPEGALLKAITTLEPGEEWLLKPEIDPLNPCLCSPGIKLGVKEGSFMHQTELFGPILGLMKAENIHHALRIANSTPYGLTSGLHSLDEREHVLWEKNILAGNLYINRTITGAVVQRQPFGGTKASGYGSGAKAGGPNYVAQILKISELELPKEKAPLPASLAHLISSLSLFNLTDEERHLWKTSVENYAYFTTVFKEKTDPSKILGQTNSFYQVPLKKMTLRLEKRDLAVDYLRVIAACLCAKTPLEISVGFPFQKIAGTTLIVESKTDFEKRLKEMKNERVRLLHPPYQGLLEAANEHMVYLVTAPVLSHGRFEMLHYLREVSLSVTTHRYGNLINSEVT